jgi:hypothetical protein
MGSLRSWGRTNTSGRRGRELDRIAVTLLLLLATWALVSASGRSGSRPGPVVLLVASSGALVVAGRLVGRRARAAVPGVVAVGVGGAVLLTLPEIWAAGGAPTGYGNANACLASLGAVSAVACGCLTEELATRRGFAGLAALMAGAVFATASTAGLLVLAAAAVLTVAALATRHAAAAVVGGLVVLSLALGVTTAIAKGSDLFGLRERSGVRADLWSEAVELAEADPLRGVGAGSFADASGVSTDPDLRWAHADFLQQAAEQGVIGLTLLLALVGCAFARLWVGRRPRVRTLTGTAALTVVSLHATVDHVVAHATVPLTLAVLVGWATVDLPDARPAQRDLSHSS